MMQQEASKKGQETPKPAFKEPPLKFRAARYTAIVKEVFDITPKYPETYLIRFTFENLSQVFDYQAGQFISVFAEKDGKSISRPYSVASPPESKEHMELAIKVVEGGFMSNYLHHVAPGTKLKTIGPLGRFVLLEPPERDIMFVSTGTGVAPFVAMLGHIFAMDYDVELHVVFGVRYLYDLIYRDLFERWAREHKNLHFYPTISRPETPDWKGRVGYVQKIIENEIADKENKDVYICGLHDMVEQVKLLCENLNFHLVRFEKWD